MDRRYERTLGWVLRHKTLTVAVILGLFAVAIILAGLSYALLTRLVFVDTQVLSTERASLDIAAKALKKAEKIVISAAIFDLMNTPLARSEPTKFLNRPDGLARAAFTFSPARFSPGVYRVELLVDDKPVWRSFVTVTE